VKIAVGADHAGFDAKEQVKAWLQDWGHDVDDLGTHGTDPVDYPAYAVRVARKVAAGEDDLGMLVCGSGIGVCIAANKVRGIRAAYATDTYSAKMARAHNDANVLCLGARVTGPELMRELVAGFLASSFEGGRHQRRVDQIAEIEKGALVEEERR
jgi:ribose 5-phosphate isomerase B